MPPHKKADGKQVIADLTELGKSLGYYVRKEYPIPGKGKNRPAVDIAWFGDSSQIHPLMIFEVESAAGNTIANNAMKVFAQPNDAFEKPLFFFHVVLKGAARSTRVEALKLQYSSPNYRVYAFDSRDGAQLLKDVLSQHRRVRDTLDLITLVYSLEGPSWHMTAIDRVLDHAETLGFRSPYRAQYAALSRTRPLFLHRFVARLASETRANQRIADGSEYDGYFGGHWPVPIHLALLCRCGDIAQDKFTALLKDWQLRTSYYPMIGPSFGLSRDYDEFVLSLAAPFLASIVAIAGAGSGARVFVVQQLDVIFEKIKRKYNGVTVHFAIWMLHLSAKLKDKSLFERYREYLNRNGGVSLSVVTQPPFGVYLDDPSEWERILSSDAVPVPVFEKFGVEPTQVEMNEEALRLGIALLSTEGEFDIFTPSVVQLLATDSLTQ